MSVTRDSGLKLTCVVAGTCPSALSLVGGGRYVLTSQDGLIHAGVENCDSDDS